MTECEYKMSIPDGENLCGYYILVDKNKKEQMIRFKVSEVK